MSPRCSISGIGTDSEIDNVQRSGNKINQYVGKVEWGTVVVNIRIILIFYVH